jgi:type I restriction enzyme S subunit
MTQLETLIQTLCPNGVPVVSIGDIVDNKTISMGRGNVISKKDLQDYPGEYPVYSSSAVGNGELGRYGKYMFEDERISWSIDGGGKFFYRNAEKYSVTNVCGWIKVINESLLSCKYLYYALLNEWSKKHYDYSHKAHPSVIAKEYQIPLPPLAVQSEIVRILDKFTLYKSELAAELAARLQQYEYYRDKLLTFDDTVKRVKLGEVVNVLRGKRLTKSDLNPEAQYNVYHGGIEPLGKYNEANREGNTVMIINVGASAGSVGYSREAFWSSDGCFCLSKNDLVDSRFLYYYLLTQEKHLQILSITLKKITLFIF